MNRNAQYDIAVTGGGLAGLSFAIQGAKAGYKVALYEKETYPFHKVCGEYISLESKPFLTSLGIDTTMLQLPVISKLNITDVYGNTTRFALPLGGFGISRYLLDGMLNDIAKKLGVEVFTNTKVHDISFINNRFAIATDKHQHTATVAAGCFGKRSNLDVKLKRPFITNKIGRLENYIGIKYHVNYPNPSDEISLHNFSNGYCGISAIEEDKNCLCYLTNAANLKASNNSIKQMEKNILHNNPHLKTIFTKAEFLYNEPLAISQISFTKKTQVEDHILMIGDAAGLVTPLCGNGMSMALHASKLAFEQANMFLENKITRAEMETNYTNTWQRHFSKRLFMGRTIQRVFGGNTSTSLFLKTMNKSPFLSRKIIESTHGEAF